MKYVKHYKIRNSECTSDFYAYNECHFGYGENSEEYLFEYPMITKHLKRLPKLKSLDFDYMVGGASNTASKVIDCMYDNNKFLEKVNVRMPIVCGFPPIFDIDGATFELRFLKELQVEVCDMLRYFEGDCTIEPSFKRLEKLTAFKLAMGDNMDAPIYPVKDETFRSVAETLSKLPKLKRLMFDLDTSVSS
mmetsp:Transcript_12837/g.10971  ORF Transcript_12837/g.10971 Transcript_12837/m.10971 type:complete len:191 (-) Transcript_12837:594-1166(-)